MVILLQNRDTDCNVTEVNTKTNTKIRISPNAADTMDHIRYSLGAIFTKEAIVLPICGPTPSIVPIVPPKFWLLPPNNEDNKGFSVPTESMDLFELEI